jgi:multicomponent Na+:H+ antiporter subunit G
MSLLGAVLMLIGSLFCLLSAVGILRFPDLYTRLHAAAKAGTLGAGLLLLGAGVSSEDFWILLRSIAGLAFLIVVGPVSAHLLARSALRTGTIPDNIPSIVQLDKSPERSDE